MRLALIIPILLAVIISPVKAANFDFDLTPLVGNDLATAFPEVEVDVGQEFTEITAAEFLIFGTFQPGRMRAVGPEPNTNPVIPTDTVNLAIKVGEIGTTYFEKELFAGQSFVGLEGNLELAIPLLEVLNTNPPVLNPTVQAPTSFDSLLDGNFGLSALMAHSVFLLYEVIENPSFEVEQFILHIEGTPVPEPTTAAMLVLIASLLCVRRFTSRHGLV